jgi:hypothetical protein
MPCRGNLGHSIRYYIQALKSGIRSKDVMKRLRRERPTLHAPGTFFYFPSPIEHLSPYFHSLFPPLSFHTNFKFSGFLLSFQQQWVPETEIKTFFSGVERGRCARLTTSPPPVSRLSRQCESSAPHTTIVSVTILLSSACSLSSVIHYRNPHMSYCQLNPIDTMKRTVLLH